MLANEALWWIAHQISSLTKFSIIKVLCNTLQIKEKSCKTLPEYIITEDRLPKAANQNVNTKVLVINHIIPLISSPF